MKANKEVKHDAKVAIYLFALFALFLISFSAMSSYFSYDEIGPLASRFKAERGYTTTQVTLLYSVYSIPVILLVVFGGLISDKLGVRWAALLFTVVFTIGTILVNINNYMVMIVGRLFFGIGAEAFYVVMNKAITKWFKDKGLAFGFGINLFLCRGGTIAAFYALPLLAERYSLSTSLWIVTGITLLGLLATIGYWFVDRYGERKNYVAIPENKKDDKPFKLREAFALPKPFWVISLLCMVYYSAIFPFTSIGVDFFRERYSISDAKAGQMIIFITFIAMMVSWLFGIIVDKIGKRATLMIIGSVAIIPCHISMAYTDINPIIPLIVLGLSFALVPAALWPAIPLMIKERNIGTAYGVVAMIQNLGLFIFNIFTGVIRDATGTYKPVMLMFGALGIIGVVFAVWLKVLEKKGGGYLDKVYK